MKALFWVFFGLPPPPVFLFAQFKVFDTRHLLVFLRVLGYTFFSVCGVM